MVGDYRARTGSWWGPAARHDVPAASPQPYPVIIDKVVARAAVDGAGRAPVTAWISAGSALSTGALRTALLAESAEALLSEHQADQGGRCHTCGVPYPIPHAHSTRSGRFRRARC